MIEVYCILVILVGHFIFDFVLQSDSMAKGKSKSNFDLSRHVAVYFFGLSVMNFFFTFGGVEVTMGWVFINAGLHWITDYFTSRYNAKLWSQGRTHDFFVGIGADQMLHYATLILTLFWFKN